jgi:ketosteroid isomerase-like protein
MEPAAKPYLNQALGDGQPEVVKENIWKLERLKLHPLGQAHNMSDLDGMMALCEPEVCQLPGPAAASGTDAVRESYRAILESKPRMELGHGGGDGCGADLCLVLFRWTSTASLPGGTSKTFSGLATDIVRQQSDGRWLLVLDNSYGVRRIP